MTPQNLKRCPFCACNAIYVHSFWRGSRVECANSTCLVTTPWVSLGGGTTDDEAAVAEIWNNRPEQKP